MVKISPSVELSPAGCNTVPVGPDSFMTDAISVMDDENLSNRAGSMHLWQALASMRNQNSFPSLRFCRVLTEEDGVICTQPTGTTRNGLYRFNRIG